MPTYGRITRRLSTRQGISRLEAELEKKGKMDHTYWLCVHSVNQHARACECGRHGTLSEEDDSPKCKFGCEVSENDKFDDVMAELHMRVPHFGQIIAVDWGFTIFSRTWCLIEIMQAQKLCMPQKVKAYSSKSVRLHRKSVKTIDLRHCQTTTQRDMDFICTKIDDVDEFNADVRDLLAHDAFGLLANWAREASGRSFMNRTAGFRGSMTPQHSLRNLARLSGPKLEDAACGTSPVALPANCSAPGCEHDDSPASPCSVCYLHSKTSAPPPPDKPPPLMQSFFSLDSQEATS